MIKEFIRRVYQEGNNSAQMPECFETVQKEFTEFWKEDFEKSLKNSLSHSDIMDILKDTPSEQLSKIIRGLSKIEQSNWFKEKGDRDKHIQKNQIAYRKRVEKQTAVGLELSKKLTVGDVVQMRGTKDHNGYREVTGFNANDIECRKITLNRRECNEIGILVFDKHSIMTVHGKGKLKKILDPSTYKIKL